MYLKFKENLSATFLLSIPTLGETVSKKEDRSLKQERCILKFQLFLFFIF